MVLILLEEGTKFKVLLVEVCEGDLISVQQSKVTCLLTRVYVQFSKYFQDTWMYVFPYTSWCAENIVRLSKYKLGLSTQLIHAGTCHIFR